MIFRQKLSEQNLDAFIQKYNPDVIGLESERFQEACLFLRRVPKKKEILYYKGLPIAFIK